MVSWSKMCDLWNWHRKLFTLIGGFMEVSLLWYFLFLHLMKWKYLVFEGWNIDLYYDLISM